MMAVGGRPFTGSDIKTVIANILSADPALPETLSPDLRDLLARMLAKSPDARITLPEIKAHQWFAGYTDWSTFPVNVAGLKVCDLESFDSVVVTEMKALRIDANHLLADLQDAARSEAAVVYKMLRREHICDLLAEAARRDWAIRRGMAPRPGKATLATAPKSVAWVDIAPSATQPKAKLGFAKTVRTLPLVRRNLQRRASLAPESFPKLGVPEPLE
jgi:hypothetical protein